MSEAINYNPDLVAINVIDKLTQSLESKADPKIVSSLASYLINLSSVDNTTQNQSSDNKENPLMPVIASNLSNYFSNIYNYMMSRRRGSRIMDVFLMDPLRSEYLQLYSMVSQSIIGASQAVGPKTEFVNLYIRNKDEIPTINSYHKSLISDKREVDTGYLYFCITGTTISSQKFNNHIFHTFGLLTDGVLLPYRVNYNRSLRNRNIRFIDTDVSLFR